MKNLTLSFLTLAALSSCADPVLQMPEKKDSAVKKTAAASMASCQVLDSKYVKNDPSGKSSTIEIHAKKDGAKISYAFGGSLEFMLADGQPKPSTMNDKKVTVTLSCDATSITAVIQQDGQKSFDTIIYVISGDKQTPDKQIDVKGNTGDNAGLNGIYFKDAGTPVAPVAPADPATPAPVVCPTLSGTFASPANLEVKLDTKVDAGKFSYSVNGKDFQLADGQPKRVESETEKGSITISCDSTSVTVVTQADGKDALSTKYSPLSDTQIKVEGSGDAAANGTYTKK